ncbi:class I SAM-dependent methyltransferase [Streptomyces sp. NA04227]|nr:class I SAM-dependent methyltransferase [Streptomyces sp. NA04227]
MPGRAGEWLASLGPDRVQLCGVYDELGAPLYEDLCRRDTFEVREIVSLVRTTRGPVLDLAAGTGRLTLPLLAAGREVTALELSPYMLELLGERLAEAPARLREKCTPVRGDMASFALDARFGAVVLGTTSVSLLDAAGRAGLYRCVREHLAEGGLFLLSTVDVRTGDGTEQEVRVAATGASGQLYHLHEHHNPEAGTRTVTLHRAQADEAPLDENVLDENPLTVCTSTVAVLPSAQLEAELTAAGFRVRAQHRPAGSDGRHDAVLLEAEVAPR